MIQYIGTIFNDVISFIKDFIVSLNAVAVIIAIVSLITPSKRKRIIISFVGCSIAIVSLQVENLNESDQPKVEFVALHNKLEEIDHQIKILAINCGEIKSDIIKVMPKTQTKVEGKTFESQLIVIHKDYNWQYSSWEVIEYKGRVVSDFSASLKKDAFQKIIDENFKAILCIGMASCEGEAENEKTRGARRSRQLVSWLSEAFPKNKFHQLDIYGINLGKNKLYGEQCRKLSRKAIDAQSRVLIMGIRKDFEIKKGMPQIKEALKKTMRKIAISAPDKLPINPDDYLEFEMLY
jgi:hypothetical protein